jgi:hypothetical protein
MWVIVALALLGVSAPQSLKDKEEYCAFEVTVRSSRNQPVPDAIVVMFDEDGKEFASAVVNEKGIARLCDAPPGLIRLAVGGNRCGATSVSYLQRYWMQTRRVTITYDNCSGEEWTFLGGCDLMLRVRARDGTPLAGATLRDPAGRLKTREHTSVSDRWGRIFLFLHYGDHFSVTLDKHGYSPQVVSAECKPGDAFSRDLTVTLEPIRRE